MMGKIKLLFWIGLVMLFLPFLGIPNVWKTGLAIFIGLVLIVLSFSIRRGIKLLKFKLRRLEQPVVDQSIHG